MSHALHTMRGRIALSVVSLAVLATVAGLAVFSAFSSTAASSSNTFAAGTVTLASDGNGTAALNLDNMKPGDTASQCVTVNYTGSLAAGVQMYGTVVDGGLAPYLSATLTRGSFPGGAPGDGSCTGFTADASNAVLFDGTLDALPDSSSPIADPATWQTNDSHTYELTVTLPANVPDGAQGTDAQASLTWQAQNS